MSPVIIVVAMGLTSFAGIVLYFVAVLKLNPEFPQSNIKVILNYKWLKLFKEQSPWSSWLQSCADRVEKIIVTRSYHPIIVPKREMKRNLI
jgi:hypothetical protein